MNFASLGLAESIVRSVVSEGYSIPTPIQAQAIPHALEGRDVLGCAQTGTGKTAAFALPILQRLSESDRRAGFSPHVSTHVSPHVPNDGSKTCGLKPARQPARRARCLILCPTRELATQISDDVRTYGK